MRHAAIERIPSKKKRRDRAQIVARAIDIATDTIAERRRSGIDLRGGIDGAAPEEVDALLVIEAEAQGIVRKHLHEIDFDRYDTLVVGNEPIIERAFTMRLPKAAGSYFGGYHGTVDWGVLDREVDAVFVADYKVRSSFNPPEAEEVNLQLAMYQRLLLANGIMTDGTLMFQIKAAAPREPELLKSGKALSRQDINTDWDTYLNVITRHGFDPDDYLDMQQKLATKEWRRIERTYRSETEVKAIWDQIVLPAAAEISDFMTNAGSVVAGKRRSWNHMTCQGCWARDFCVAELRNEDTEFLLETRFVDHDNPRQRVILNPDNFVFVED